MDVAELAIALAGTLAGIVAAYFAWLQIRRKPSEKPPATVSAAPTPHNDGDDYDVFISYSHADTDEVEKLAGELGGHGVRVAMDRLFLGPTDVIVHKVDAALRDSIHGLVVYSPASLASEWVANEYAVLMRRAIENRRRFAPVLIGDIRLDDVPEFARARYFTDLRSVSPAIYGSRVRELAQALRKPT
ncbi:hypothetical protein Aph01nite_59000 [Acrocarpospora phusangensis]|uniref:TIR domain-containing protein n=1 Tax=Acrocarpospora phusangensis TaxID=1070424 RepID=A0A919UTN9_9ACTN|nr:toll/interleukin-1 receptor domain-containing protein [Acrocarpospora phusangensis]GIH27590.1 hypothetical protein Aph01nite_59000 [Acrocarpospora phusangensis]